MIRYPVRAITNRRLRMLEIIMRHPGISLRELQAIFGMSSVQGVKGHLEALRDKGLVSWEPGKARLGCIHPAGYGLNAGQLKSRAAAQAY